MKKCLSLLLAALMLAAVLTGCGGNPSTEETDAPADTGTEQAAQTNWNVSSVTGTGTERGVVFQQYALFPWLTVKKNVMFALEMRGVKGKEAEEEALKYLAMVDLVKFADHYPKELSGGMKQRVAIARAYAANPEVLLMDEPFGALDAVTRARLQDMVLELWRKQEPKKTVFFVTHDVDEAIYMGTRVIVMEANPGRIKADIPLTMDYPRNRSRSQFVAYRNQILEMLNYGAKE